MQHTIRRKTAAAAALALCATLGAATRRPEPRRLTGHYVVGWEEQSFQPCGSGERWWVADPGPLMARYRQVVKGNFGVLFVTVRAEVSERGSWGHLGMFPRMMAVRQVEAARAPADDDCHEHEVEVE